MQTFLMALGVCRYAHGTHEVLDGIALVLVIEQLRGRADDLKDDLRGALFGVCARHSQWDTLASLIHAQDDKLARLGFPGHQRRFDLHLGDGGIQRLLTNNLVHKLTPDLYCRNSMKSSNGSCPSYGATSEC